MPSELLLAVVVALGVGAGVLAATRLRTRPSREQTITELERQIEVRAAARAVPPQAAGTEDVPAPLWATRTWDAPVAVAPSASPGPSSAPVGDAPQPTTPPGGDEPSPTGRGLADAVPSTPDDVAPPRRPGDDAGYGRLGVLLAALFVGLPLLGLLLAWYVSITGQLPFTIRQGPWGLPAWGPFLVLLGVVGLACFLPILARNFSDRDRTFWDQVATNKRNSVFLATAVVGGVALTGYVIGTVLTLSTDGGLIVGTVTLAAALVAAIVSYRSGDRIILRVSGARPIADGEEPVLHDVVAELAVAADVPPPRLFLIDDTAPNAFVAGRDPGHAVMAVTRGLLADLDREELQGVVAHEISHIRNYDSRYDLFVSVLAGTTVLIADGFFQVVTWPFRLPWRIFRAFGNGGVDRGSRRVSGSGSGGSWSFPDIDLGDGGGGGGGGKGGGLAILLAIVIFVVLVLVVSAIVYAIAPIFARLLQASVSREREYLADASAVELGRNPAALERALAKVASTEEVLEVANRATAPLYFVNPIRAFEKRASAIYSTHPSTADRIDRLRVLQGLPPLTAREAMGFKEDED